MSNSFSVDATLEIQKANDRFMEAYNSHDARLVATEIFDSSASIYPPGSPVISGGAAVLESFWQAVMDSGVHEAIIKTHKATRYGDIAIDVGSVTLYDAEANIIDDAKYIVEWIKVNDAWRITKDIWNSNKPPA